MSKTIKICPNQHTDLLRFHFTKNSVKLKKRTTFQATFFVELLDKKFSLVILHKLAKFYHQTVFTAQVIQ